MPKTIHAFLSESKLKNGQVMAKILFRARAITRKHAQRVLNSEIHPQILEIFEDETFITNPNWFEDKGLKETISWVEYANDNLSSDQIATLILAAADIDPDTTRTMSQAARKNHLKRKISIVEHLEILLNSEDPPRITEGSLRDLIHFCSIGQIKPYALDLHIENNIDLLSNDESGLYEKIKEIDTEMDDIVVDFFYHRLPFEYLEKVRGLGRNYQAEFWNWVGLKYTTDIQNPETIFFNYYDSRESFGLNFSGFQKMRDSLESLGAAGLSGTRNATGLIDFDYDYFEELQKIEIEMRDFHRAIIRPRHKTDIHHIFFPEKKYKDGDVLAKFRGQKRNTVRILKNSHAQMNEHFDRLRRERKYEIPVISAELLAVLESSRRTFDNDGYLNFLEIKRVLVETLVELTREYSRKELESNDLFANTAEMYRFLKICSRFISKRTTYPNKK